MNRNRLKLVVPEDTANESREGEEHALGSMARSSAETQFLHLVQADEGPFPDDAA
jgi:hypothetical protein